VRNACTNDQLAAARHKHTLQPAGSHSTAQGGWITTDHAACRGRHSSPSGVHTLVCGTQHRHDQGQRITFSYRRARGGAGVLVLFLRSRRSICRDGAGRPLRQDACSDCRAWPHSASTPMRGTTSMGEACHPCGPHSRQRLPPWLLTGADFEHTYLGLVVAPPCLSWRPLAHGASRSEDALRLHAACMRRCWASSDVGTHTSA